MKAQKSNDRICTKQKIFTLWIVVMFTMIFADFFSFITPGVLKQIMEDKTDPQTSQWQILVFAILTEIPIMMILLSRVLPNKANRWANIIASIITIVYVIGGGSADFHYIFFATVEVTCMLFIIWYAWKWKNQKDFKEKA